MSRRHFCKKPLRFSPTKTAVLPPVAPTRSVPVDSCRPQHLRRRQIHLEISSRPTLASPVPAPTPPPTSILWHGIVDSPPPPQTPAQARFNFWDPWRRERPRALKSGFYGIHGGGGVLDLVKLCSFPSMIALGPSPMLASSRSGAHHRRQPPSPCSPPKFHESVVGSIEASERMVTVRPPGTPIATSPPTHTPSGAIFSAMMAGSSCLSWAFVSGLKNATASQESLLVDLLELSWSTLHTTNYTSTQQAPRPLPGLNKLHRFVFRRSTPAWHG